jgi:hypothetical protein
MVEETQAHISSLGISCPPLGNDQRHAESSKYYPFMDYDILSGEEDEGITLHECISHDLARFHVDDGSFQLDVILYTTQTLLSR